MPGIPHQPIHTPDPPTKLENDDSTADGWKAQVGAFYSEWNAREREGTNQAVADRSVQGLVLQALLNGYVTVSQASLDRAVSRGTYVTTAASAIATAYTALLGASYTSAQNGTRLAGTALIPAIFLGLAIAFSVAYIAFLKQSRPTRPLLAVIGDDGANRLYNIAENGSALDLDERLERFCEWTYGGVRDKWGFLHMAVYSLAFGVGFLPVPFLKFESGSAWAAFWCALGVLTVTAVVLFVKSRKSVSAQPLGSIAAPLQP